jgi:hypothetical protein
MMMRSRPTTMRRRRTMRSRHCIFALPLFSLFGVFMTKGRRELSLLVF